MKYRPKTKPFPYQARATLRAVKHRNYGIFMEPRLGKSKVALDYAGILALKGEVKRILIICPAIAKEVWTEQIELHYPFICTVETFDEEWEIIDRDWVHETPSFFIAGQEETFRRVRVNTRYRRPKQTELEKWAPDVVVIDESHGYKRAGGVASQDAWRMVRRMRKRRANGQPYVLLLTGTPNPKGYIDLFAQFRIMDDSIFGTNAGDFEERHVEYGQGKQQYRIIRYRGVRQLDRKIRENSIAVSADEAGMAGHQTWQSIPVDLPEKAKRIYLDMAAEFVAEWEKGLIDAANPGVKRIRLLQITGGFTTGGDCIHDAKVRALRGYAKQLLEQDEPFLVFCRFTPEVEAAVEACERVGYQVGQISGGVKPMARRQFLSRFRSGSGPQALVLQVQAGSVSIDLSRAAESIYYSTPDGWVAYWQSLNRTRGPNQTRPTRYTHLIARGTLDRSVVNSLKGKEDWHAKLMQNPRRYLTDL
jgi:SNF2 family DNA or RNA helicase